MNAFNKLVLGLCILSQIGCATTFKGKVLQNTLAAGALGAAYGNSTSSHQSTHAAMYGGIAATITALATVYYLDPDSQVDSVRKTSNRLREELDAFDQSSSPKRAGVVGGPAINSFEKLPPEYRKMVDPGQWTLYQIDEWVDGGEGRLIHQDKMLEIKPATLKGR